VFLPQVSFFRKHRHCTAGVSSGISLERAEERRQGAHTNIGRLTPQQRLHLNAHEIVLAPRAILRHANQIEHAANGCVVASTFLRCGG
jgi:hypothetical protein